MNDANRLDDSRATPVPTGRALARSTKRLGVFALVAGFGALALPSLPPWNAQGPGLAQAANCREIKTSDRKTFDVAIDQSRVATNWGKAKRVSVANPDIVDILPLTDSQFFVLGKRIGTTNAMLWNEDECPTAMILLEVTPDLDLLKSRLHEVMPGERIEVRSAQGTLVLSGSASSAEKAAAAVQVAQSFAAGGQVLNMIQVGGSQQVMLEVKVAEISRTLAKRLDINFTVFQSGDTFKIGTTGNSISTPPVGLDPLEPWDGSVGISTLATQGRSIFMNSLRGDFLFNMVIDAAKENGLAKVLAEPNLTTLSGQEAKFLAGGEFPVPVAQENGNTTIEYKEYGVGLNFVPYVLDSGVISLKVNVSVSELNNSNSVLVGTGTSTTNFVPALNKRSANSTVEVRTGETIAIAGLINETLRENVSRFPGLGDLALLGTLFRSQDFIKGQTELMIFVTPRLANSFDPQLVRLPTDSFVEPNDREFYLMGRLDACRNRKGQSLFTCGGALGPDVSGSEGVFGHDL